MTESSGKGTAKYIVGKVERFDQKNELYKRTTWDPPLQEMGREFYGPRHFRSKVGYQHEDFALQEASWYIEHAFAHGNIIHDTGMFSWKGLARTQMPSDLKLSVGDPARMSRSLKKVGRFLGASEVGICELDRRWIYSHSLNRLTHEHKELEIPRETKNAVVMLFEMDYELTRTSPAWPAASATGKAYSQMPFTASMLAQFIRGLGYQAIPSGNDTGLSVPMAIDAGLGELGRSGLLISREFGPRVRIAKVLTDLPLVPDEPIEFGVTEFCAKCKKCAEFCPGQAIIHGERTTEVHNISNAGGQLKWPINAEKCLAFWVRNQGSCTNCVRVCPFNKPSGWTHDAARWLVKHTPWTDGFLVKMDDLFGYGKPKKADGFWRE